MWKLSRKQHIVESKIMLDELLITIIIINMLVVFLPVRTRQTRPLVCV